MTRTASHADCAIVKQINCNELCRYLIVVDSRLFNSSLYKALAIVSHSYFHQRSSTLAYVPEDIVMYCLHAQITFVNVF